LCLILCGAGAHEIFRFDLKVSVDIDLSFSPWIISLFFFLRCGLIFELGFKSIYPCLTLGVFNSFKMVAQEQPKTKVLIIGCGVAGPVMALLLKRKGYAVVVLEKVRKLGDAGGSLMMMSNG
jgi:hypothetical protein